jgi:hypothetical protein
MRSQLFHIQLQTAFIGFFLIYVGGRNVKSQTEVGSIAINQHHQEQAT